MTVEPITLIEQEGQAISKPELGLLRQVLAYTDNLMLVRHQMDEGWTGTKHSHPHEQLVYVISGRIRFTGGGKSFEARAGDSFIVPGGVEHQASAIEKSEALDVFTPAREDYAASKEDLGR